MADLTGHAAGNGGHSQGTPTAHRALLYSDISEYDLPGVSRVSRHKYTCFTGSAYPIADLISLRCPWCKNANGTSDIR